MTHNRHYSITMKRLSSTLLALLLMFTFISTGSAQTVTGSAPTFVVDQLPPPGDNATLPRPIDVDFGTPVSVSGNESVQLMTPSGIYVNVTSGDSVEITIDMTTTNPYSAVPEGLVSVGIFLQIEMNDTSVDVDATIAIPFNDSMVDGIDADTLEFRFYNETSGLWDSVTSWVDLDSMMVYGNTTHFSTWTVTGDESVDQTPPPPPEPPVNDSRIPVNVTLGSPVSVRGNESVQLVTPSGIYVNVTPSEGVEITVNMTTSNPYSEVPEGLVSIGIFLEIEMNDTSVDVDATIAIPYNDSMGVDPSTLVLQFYNVTSGEWESVPSWVDTASNMVFGNTTHFSTWTATGEESPDQTTPPVTGPPEAVPGVPFEVELGKPVAVSPGNRVELVTPSGVSVSVTPGEGVEITIDEFSANPAGDIPAGLASLGLYLSIEVNETDVEIDATLSLPYQASDVADLAIETLVFRFYNEATGTWDAVPSWVDTENNMVYGNTTHFSTWTVTGDVPEDSSTTLAETPLIVEFMIASLVTVTVLQRRRK